MQMKRILAASAALALALGGSASAATYVSYFDWSNTGAGGAVTHLAGTINDANSWGKITIVEGVNRLDFTVELFDAVGFLNTGKGPVGNKQPFTFNADAAYTVTPSNANDPNPSDSHPQTFFYGGHQASPANYYENVPFGHFSDYIGCCNSIGDIKNGSVAASPAPLKIAVLGTGITIANLFSNTDGAKATGAANAGGWWFTADVTDSFDGGNTFTIAARDITCITCTTGGVPEPATWGMMILGFFGTGALIRNRRRFGLTA